MNAASKAPLRIVKVGGSLLDWPPLPRALRTWLDDQPAARNVLICGGGPFTNAIREADRVYALGETTAHWLCVDALAVSARLLASLLGDAPLVDELKPEALAKECGPPAQAHHASMIFDPRRFLIELEPLLPGCVLPRNWSATTDSIAARVAESFRAQDLVMLKSADPPAFTSAQDLAAAGYVDLHFPRAAAGIARWRCVNLRAVESNSGSKFAPG
jgi:dihydroneopterin aldolase